MLRYLQPFSRALVALIFIISGFGKITGFDQTAAMMTGAGIPAAKFFLVPTIIIELIGGIALLVGYKTQLFSFLLVLYLIPVTIMIHAVHMFEPGQAGQQQMIQVLKNLALMGGLLKFFTDGGGAYSFDARDSIS